MVEIYQQMATRSPSECPKSAGTNADSVKLCSPARVGSLTPISQLSTHLTQQCNSADISSGNQTHAPTDSALRNPKLAVRFSAESLLTPRLDVQQLLVSSAVLLHLRC